MASALVNTSKVAARRTAADMALTATASYLTAHHPGRLAPVTAAVHGYTVAFAVSAVLFGIGALAAVLLLPSRRRLEELRNPAPAAVPRRRPAVPEYPSPKDSLPAA